MILCRALSYEENTLDKSLLRTALCEKEHALKQYHIWLKTFYAGKIVPIFRIAVLLFL